MKRGGGPGASFHLSPPSQRGGLNDTPSFCHPVICFRLLQHQRAGVRPHDRGGQRLRRLSTSRLQQHSARRQRSEEHTSELQSLAYLVCRLLLEKKNDKLCVRD